MDTFVFGLPYLGGQNFMWGVSWMTSWTQPGEQSYWLMDNCMWRQWLCKRPEGKLRNVVCPKGCVPFRWFLCILLLIYLIWSKNALCMLAKYLSFAQCARQWSALFKNVEMKAVAPHYSGPEDLLIMSFTMLHKLSNHQFFAMKSFGVCHVPGL